MRGVLALVGVLEAQRLFVQLDGDWQVRRAHDVKMHVTLIPRPSATVISEALQRSVCGVKLGGPLPAPRRAGAVRLGVGHLRREPRRYVVLALDELASLGAALAVLQMNPATPPPVAARALGKGHGDESPGDAIVVLRLLLGILLGQSQVRLHPLERVLPQHVAADHRGLATREPIVAQLVLHDPLAQATRVPQR